MVDGEKGYVILNSKVEWIITNMKAIGTDPVELFNFLFKEGIEEIIEIRNKIYDWDVWPDDIVKIVMIPISKKMATKKISGT